MRANFPGSPSHLSVAHDHLSAVLRAGDHAVDATAGNGYDCLFLAECVGPSGSITAFDVQRQALENSRRRLASQDITTRVNWVQDSHAELARYIRGPVRAAIFNLGYLPGADKSVSTTKDKTVKALIALAPLIEAGGRVSIVCYTGHSGGEDEYLGIRQWARGCAKDEWQFMEWRWLNRSNAPIVIFGQKASLRLA
jgi:hypothetical protein